jgi:UMF1 family MFS transporter
MDVIQKNDKKLIRAWTFYDWANSSFPLVINSAIFPAFYEYQTTHDQHKNITTPDVEVFGHLFKNTEFYSYIVSLSLLVVCFTAPILSGIADYSGSKKRFLQFFCFLGSVSCAGLFFFDRDHIALSMIPFMLATIGFWGSLVFYNAYLPEIADVEMQDNVSARGFAMGYFGSSLLLILNLIALMVFNMPAKWSFVTVAVWWLGFSQFTFKKLPHIQAAKSGEGHYLLKGFRELKNVWEEIKHLKRIKRFLASYFFYGMGVQTVMYMATLFAGVEIEWGDDKFKKTALIISILLIQFLGIAGSFLFSFFSKKIGNIKALGIAIFIWVIICVCTYAFVRTPLHFFITAASVGLVMGGIQALSRSTYSKFLPETKDHASYFSFFDVVEKLGIVIGVFAFGFINGITGSMRDSVLSLIAFFVIGFLLLLIVPAPKEKN